MAWLQNWLMRRSTRYRTRVWNRSLVAHARTHDAEQNAASAPPPNDEVIALRTIWIAEAFTLSNIARLSDRLASIPRSAHGFGGTDVERALQTLQDFPASVTGGGWISLGVIVRGRGGAFELDPPAGVERVWLWLHGLLPSLTVLVAAFVFTEDDAEEPTRLLRQQWETRLSNKQLLTPDFRKERAIRALRYQRKREFSTWLSETFGVRGVFASGVLEGGRYPATEWWTTRIARPLDPNRSALDADSMRILELARPFHVWTAEGLGGQRMIEAETDAAERDAPSYSLVLAGSPFRWSVWREWALVVGAALS